MDKTQTAKYSLAAFKAPIDDYFVINGQDANGEVQFAFVKAKEPIDATGTLILKLNHQLEYKGTKETVDVHTIYYVTKDTKHATVFYDFYDNLNLIKFIEIERLLNPDLETDEVSILVRKEKGPDPL